MLSVIYINLVPELSLTAAQLVGNFSKRRGGDQHRAVRSARAEGNGGLGRIARRQPQRSHNRHSKRAAFLTTQSRSLWIRDRHALQRPRLRRVRLAARHVCVGGLVTQESIGDRVRTNSSLLLPSASTVTSSSRSPAPSGRSAHCGSGAWPRPERGISPYARSDNWLALVWRSGETDKATQSSAKYRRGRFPRDPPSFGRTPKQIGDRRTVPRKHASVPIFPISAKCACPTCADDPFRPVAIAALVRLRSELEHVRNATLCLKQTQSNGAQRLSARSREAPYESL